MVVFEKEFSSIEEIVSLACDIRPVITGNDGLLYYIKNVSINNNMDGFGNPGMIEVVVDIFSPPRQFPGASAEITATVLKTGEIFVIHPLQKTSMAIGVR